jgi:hypothetical protein
MWVGISYCAMPVPHMLGNRYMYPLMLRKAEIFAGLMEAVRHAPLDVFTPSCLDMHGEYILTLNPNRLPKNIT